MPNVNGKKFAYTPAGKKAAKAYAAGDTAPSVAEFRQSAAYKTDSMTYKQYVDTMYQVHQAKYKKK